MIISALNSIRFIKQDSNFRNFGNTLTANERFFNDAIFTYCQRFLTTDTATIQIKSNSDTVPTVKAYNSDNSIDTLTASLVSSYDQDDDGTDDLFYFEFDVPMVDYQTETYLTVEQDGETWKSEPFYSDTNLYTELQDGEAMQIEYYNDDNAFSIDFNRVKSGDDGLTFTIYVESTIKDLEFGGENSIYDNQDELTKLKETVVRILNFKTLHIPRYLAEILRLASACDNFVVNGVSYVRQDLPEIAPVDGSNLVDFSMKLTDKEYLGVNSHDIGFNCDSPTIINEIMVLTELNASGSVTFTVPAGYQVHTLRAEWVSGTTVGVKLGTTLSGNELVYPFNISSSLTMITAAIHGDFSRSASVSIYATVSGGVANIDIQLIKNTQ
jgi:hypothetical protein